MNEVIINTNTSISNLLSEYSETIIPIEDSIVDGVYTRIAYANAGSVVVGCTHKKGGTAILLSGTIRQIDGDDKYEISAPRIFNTQAGTQRIALAVTDCVYATIHSVEAITTEDAEKELFVETPQITRIRNSFKTFLLEHNISNDDVKDFMNSLPVNYEHSDIYAIEKSVVDGYGSIAKRDIMKDEIIGIALKDGNRLPLARYVNHSDIPNAKFEDLENGDIILKAKVVIPQGSEIFINYRERGLK